MEVVNVLSFCYRAPRAAFRIKKEKKQREKKKNEKVERKGSGEAGDWGGGLYPHWEVLHLRHASE